MRVLVTRPSTSAERTAARLSAMGHEPILLPLFEPRHDAAAIEEALASPFCALAVTSAEAVRALSEVNISALFDVPLYAVGAVTAESARSVGFRNVTAGPGTGDELADVIAKHWTQQEAPLLYIAGNPRSPDFEVGLAAQGIPCRTVEAYRMLPQTWGKAEAGLLSTPPEAVLLYSREAAKSFFAQEILQDWLARVAAMKIFCMSPKTAAAVPAQFQGNVVVAARPSEDALMSLLSPEAGTNFP
ncbi:uroporphyrinogen-III synthase [Rhizobium oryzicola]|uniref:Uroporphyrinogen-III synthase n=1 Tax=Rhizobium oryzicola TaxID=1232668 RepID=A0ABT8SZY0_9HYPH|nr:uroporphyrinogen-III synthase [Rhizobium oryzicola]MDO1584012.1 uroporphyrinogen-III synthase [Rhizobium oryzicola]